MGTSYDYYYSKANEDLPSVATAIALDYHKYWFENRTDEVRAQYTGALKRVSSPLKIEISNYLKRRVEDSKSSFETNSEIISLKEAKFDGIITTNYDNFLECVFPDLKVYTGQEELIFSNTQNIGEIYKIHGSCEDPNSLVLTQEDYQRYNDRNAYLAAKLLTFFVEHPIIFLGYSLEDENIQKILNSMGKCLTNDNIAKLTDRLIFVLRDKNDLGDEVAKSSYVTKENFTIPITTIRTNDYSSVYDALSDLNRKLSTKALRFLKEQFYEYILTTKPDRECKVYLDIEQIEKLSEVEFVVGAGIIPNFGDRGLVGVTRDELFHDIIFDDLRYDPKKIIEQPLPNLISGNANVPIFKYLRKSGHITDENVLISDGLNSKIIQRAKRVNSNYFESGSSYLRHKEDVQKYEGIKELKEENSTFGMIWFIPLLELDKIDIDELYDFLYNEYHKFFDENGELKNYLSQMRKLICMYDWMKYGAGDDLKEP